MQGSLRMVYYATKETLQRYMLKASDLNGIQSRWAWDEYCFYDYIKDGVLHTKKVNRYVNEMPHTKKVNAKT